MLGSQNLGDCCPTPRGRVPMMCLDDADGGAGCGGVVSAAGRGDGDAHFAKVW